MADTAAAASPAAALAGPVSSPVSGKKAPGQKKSAAGSTSSGAKGSARSKPSHPPTSDMVHNAIKSLKERGGSSLQAVKKFLSANYKVDAEKLSPFIKKYLKSAVVSGALVQTKGKGASGSFKLGGPSTVSSKTATAAASGKSRSAGKPASSKAAGAKRVSTGKAKPSGAKKPKTQKKSSGGAAEKIAVSKRSGGRKKTSASQASSVTVTLSPSAKSRTPSKTKKTNKVPTKKPKAPKPKKGKSAPASPKKAGAKKK